MDLGRTAKFGSVGAIGGVLISLATSGLMWMAWNDRISGAEGMAIGTMILVGIGGLAITILFLFFVGAAFVERELEARGLDSTEE
jgi:Co/Zn/Cd efflux system component